MTENQSVTPSVENKTYLERWIETKPPKDYEMMGSAKFVKMVMFITKYPMSNEDINEWTLMKTTRDFPLRRQLSYFQRDLLNFRGYLFEYPELSQKQQKMLKKHESRN